MELHHAFTGLLGIFVTMLGWLAARMMTQVSKNRDTITRLDERVNSLKGIHEILSNEFKTIDGKLDSIDRRLSRMEGPPATTKK